MTKLLYVGDLHIRGTTPRNRLDDYPAAVSAKIAEVNRIAVEHGAQAILCAGDIFHTPEVAIGVLLRAMDDFKASKVPWYTTAGNHDLYGYNLATYQRTSLNLLTMLLPNFHVINDPSIAKTFGGGPQDAKVQVTFTPFSGRMDIDGYGYSPEADVAPYKIHVAHGMLLDHTPPWERFTLVQDVQTTADLVLCGHDHIGFGIFRRSDGKTFVNCGSLTRMSASQGEISRTPQVAIISIWPEPGPFFKTVCNVNLIDLTTAKPGEEILDRSRIEANAKRQYAMEEFAALVKRNTGEAALMNVPDIVQAIAKQEGYAPDVVAKALEKIDQARALGLK